MSEFSPSHRWHQYPPEHGHRRQQRREAAVRRLSDYLDAVSVAVRTLGFVVRAIQLGPGPDLEARVLVGTGLDGGQSEVPEEVELAWAEDVGWSVTHPVLDTPGSPTRYLHIDLAPSPDVVAEFLSAVLLDGGDAGMPYPARFRLRSQPLQPVLDALCRHTSHAGPRPSLIRWKGGKTRVKKER